MRFNIATDRPGTSDEIAWVYNGMDCLVTYEVWEKPHRPDRPR